MKQELSDLIPARGLFEVTKRADQELDKNANQCIRREISLSEFNWITLKVTARDEIVCSVFEQKSREL